MSASVTAAALEPIRGRLWPLARTDRQSTDLSADESAALATLMARVRPGCRWPRALTLSLERVFEPIYQGLALIGPPEKVRDRLLRIVARETHLRQRTILGWAGDEWLEILAPDHRLFLQRYKGAWHCREHLLSIAYLYCGFTNWRPLGPVKRLDIARNIFGREHVDEINERIAALLGDWGYKQPQCERVRCAVAEAMLAARSSDLRTFTAEFLGSLRLGAASNLSQAYFALSQALVALRYLEQPLSAFSPTSWQHVPRASTDGIAPDWLAWCQRWRETSTLLPRTRLSYFNRLLRVGRWLGETHPDVTSPEQWTRAVAAEYVGAVDRMVGGQWGSSRFLKKAGRGRSFSAGAKIAQLHAASAFFQDCQEWGWIPRRFDPRRSFAAPQKWSALTKPNPRVIADDLWAKLLWSGLNLAAEDIPHTGMRTEFYPFAMVRALTLTWLFAGLRRDELQRLRVGCIRWQTMPDQAVEKPSGPDVCLMDVPANKTGPPFTKPVDRLVGEAISAWETIRPQQPLLFDAKTSEWVDYLFTFRGRRIGAEYVNNTLIPALCRKAGIPRHDARGAITSHRARATIASQLYNAKEPMTLFELQAWLGHRSPESTQYYAKITPTKLSKAYAAADYFARNTRTIAVLLDQEAIVSGAAGRGQPWRLYDLGHGFCTYEFFDQCPHRMACAKCSFYVPKGSAQAQMVEGKANLLRLLQEIPLTDDERTAVEDGVAAFNQLLDKLSDVPTPAGPTPRQLRGETTA
jgi:integrase